MDGEVINVGLIDKRAYLQVLGCLIKDNSLIDDIDRPLDKSDFWAGNETLYQLIYVSIYNLNAQGAENIDEYAIDSYLSNYKEKYKIFQENNGLIYIEDCIDMASLDNYDMNYHIIRKMSLLRYYESKGLDTRFIYDSTIVEPEKQVIERMRFENYTEQDIVEQIEALFVVEPKINYCSNTLTNDAQAGDHLVELIEELCVIPDVGVPATNAACTSISRGQRLGCFYLRSGTTGSSKTRQAIMDACNTSIPWEWDLDKKEWIYKGFAEPTLLIETEMTVSECQSIVLAKVSGVPEEHILYGEYEKGERERVDQATEYIKSSPLYICTIDDFSISDIENIIKRYHSQHGVLYVYFDYIFATSRAIEEMAKKTGMRLQEWQILNMFAVRLKAIAVQLQIFIMSSTQLNGEAQDMRYKDARCLEGSKRIANKIDFGIISMRPTAAELKKIEKITHNIIGCPEINMLHWIYKCRRGKMSRIIVFSHINLDCLREEAVFITDYDFNLIDVDITKIECVDKMVEAHSHKISAKDFEEDPEIEAMTQQIEQYEEEEVITETSTKPKFDW